MKVQIMTHTWYGNGKLLAEALKNEFSAEDSVNIADIKNISPKKVAEEAPDALILGGAIRIFRSDPKSKRWLKRLNKMLEESGNKIQFGTGFLTHAMPTNKVQGYATRYLGKIARASMIENTYSKLLTAQVEGQKGPIYPEEMEKSSIYVKEFIEWMKQQ